MWLAQAQCGNCCCTSLLTELFFANHVLDQPKMDYENLPQGTLEELFAISVTAQGKFEKFLTTGPLEQCTEPVPLGFRDFKAGKRKMLMQVVMHSIHHRGQLATFLRQQGFKQDWTHDFLLSKVME